MALTTLKSKRKPRSRKQVIDILCTAQRLYLESGGADIDFSIEAAKRQVARCERNAGHPPEGKSQSALSLVNTAMRHLTKLQEMRERKLRDCQATIAETSEAEENEPATEEAAPTEPAPEQPQPESHLRAVPPAENTDDADITTPEDQHDQTGS